MNWIAVFLGGGLGAVARFGVGHFFPPTTGSFPWATLLSNLLATLILALLFTGTFKPGLRDEPVAWALLATGFCGGFSTFSTFSLETALLVRSGHQMWALCNVGVSVIACVGLAWWIVKQAA